MDADPAVLTEPWERQAGETAKQFEAFTAYRNLGPRRTARRVADALHRSTSLMHRWQLANAWVRRAEAYDRAIERERLLDAAGHHRDMNERTARIATAYQNQLVKRLADFDASTLTNRDLIRWFEVATKVERIVREELYLDALAVAGTSGGEPGGVTMSDEQMQARLEQLHAEIAERLGMASSGRGELGEALEADDEYQASTRLGHD